MLQENINPDDIYCPSSALVSLENTMNKGGGSVYDFREIEKIRQVCIQHNLKMHLDGARLFNALIEKNETPLQYGKVFDSISICLSKGLGAPAGSLLLGNDSFIHKSRRIRKVMGGGMRQAGFLAAAGIYALDHHIDRLKSDHQRARQLANIMTAKSYVTSLLPVETNIVIFSVQYPGGTDQLIQDLRSKGILVIKFGKSEIRLVTHLDFTDDHLELFEKKVKNLPK